MFLDYFYNKLKYRSRTRKFILISFDAIILFFTPFISLEFLILKNQSNLLGFIFTLIGILVFIYTGHYKSILKYASTGFFYRLFIRIFGIIIFSFLITFNSNLAINDLRFWILSFSIITIFTAGYRLLLRDIIIDLSKNSKSLNLKKIAIYGAGKTGSQLAANLRYSKNYKLLFFLDDSKKKINRYLNNTPIRSTNYLREGKEKVDEIFIAIPSLNQKTFKQIVEKIQFYGRPIFKIPSVEDLASGKYKLNNLSRVNIEELLRRDVVRPDLKLLKKSVQNKNICVTGGGGSIGSELCKQIYSLNPKSITIIENCEFNLYKIQKYFQKKEERNFNINYLLANCENTKNLTYYFKKYNIEIVFHAAAYKHVPLVEINPIEGIRNNVFSTLAICEASYQSHVNSLILISSDKAVRPTNIMGASKRLSELIVQAYAEKVKNSKNNFVNNKILFSMVRFGNVLDSSGSVVPLFNSQISKGGPLTLTHPEMTRYFMTVKEAVELLLQSVTMSVGGDLFLLDMGEPVKIYHLAKQMIELSGFSVRDENNLKGDIEIVYEGIRDGEKLYEELLINAKSINTDHPLIYRAIEKFIPFDELMEIISDLKIAIEDNNTSKVIRLITKAVPELKSNLDF